MKIVITGIRWEESNARQTRGIYEESTNKKQNKKFLNIIADWGIKDVWDFIIKNKYPYPEDYNKGAARIGCIGCPMSYNSGKELYLYPKFLNAYKIAIQKAMLKGKFKAFQTPEQVIDWWLSGETVKNYIKQYRLFEL